MPLKIAHPLYHSPCAPLIKEAIDKTLCELVARVAFTLLTLCFVPAGGQMLIVTTVLMGWVVNTVWRCALVAGRFFSQSSTASRSHSWLDWIPAIHYARTDSLIRDTFVHELGHLTAFKALCKGRGKISLLATGGVSKLTYQGVTRLGSWLGVKNSLAVVAASGAGFSSLASIGCITAAHFCKKTHPELSRYLNCMAIYSIAKHALYALSAYFITHPGHDFVLLASMGLSPLAAAITLVAIPILIKYSM